MGETNHNGKLNSTIGAMTINAVIIKIERHYAPFAFKK